MEKNCSSERWSFHAENMSLPVPSLPKALRKESFLTYYAKLQSDRCVCVLPGMKQKDVFFSGEGS